MWNTRFSFKFNGVELFFGVNVLKENFHRAVEGLRRVLVITSKSAARVSGALSDITMVLEEMGIHYCVYDRISPNPYAGVVDDAVEVAERERVDGILAIGGGSVIDVAKAVSLLVGSGINAREAVLGRRPTRSGANLVVVNLTHGTGSEANRFAVLTIDGTIEKRGFVARYPDVSFDDPVYTLTLSREQSLYTTIDTFYHAYESATARRSNPLVVVLAEEAVRLVATYLRRVLEKPGDLEARSMLMYASMLGGICDDLTSGSHVIHAVEHGFSGLKPELPHGAGLAAVAPPLVYHVHKAVPEVSARLLRHLDPGIRPVPEDAEKAAKAVEGFQRVHGFDKRLGDFGINEDDIRRVLEFVERMVAEKYGANTPFSVSRRLLEDAVRKAI